MAELYVHKDGISYAKQHFQKDSIQSLLQNKNQFFQQKKVSARQFLSLLGKLNAATYFVALGRLHLRPLQMTFLAQWRPHILPLDYPIKIHHKLHHHLAWWNRQQIYIHGVPIRNPPPSHQMPAKWVWQHIWNQRDIYITEFGHKTNHNSTNWCLSWRERGTHSLRLCLEVWRTLSLCHQNKIRLVIKHTREIQCSCTSSLQMTKPISKAWSLHQSVANAVFQMSKFSNIDLFATLLNHRLPVYLSPIPDKKAPAIDALTMNWNCIQAYALSPFHLIPSLLNKIHQSFQNCSISTSIAKQILVLRTTKSVNHTTHISSLHYKHSGTVTRKILSFLHWTHGNYQTVHQK